MQLTNNYKFNYLKFKKDSLHSTKINFLLKHLYCGKLYFSSQGVDKQENVNK